MPETTLTRKAIKLALEKVQHTNQLSVRAWNECGLGDMGTRQEHPLAQARCALLEAEQWLEAVLSEDC